MYLYDPKSDPNISKQFTYVLTYLLHEAESFLRN